MKKHLIFDIGGVIVWPRLGSWNIPFGIREILGSRADDIASPAYERAYASAVKWLDEGQSVPDCEAEFILRENFIREMDAAMDWRMTESEIEALAHDFTYNIDRYGFFEDVKPWLARWQGKYSLNLLSDALPSILLFMDQHGILPFCDHAVISAHVGATKPGKAMYETILEKLGANPADCLFIDDRLNNLRGAQDAGIHAVQMAREEFFPEQLWNGPIIHNFEELNALLTSGEIF